MSQTVTQVIFFRVKPSVKPEDPSSEEGETLMRFFRTNQHQSGHEHSSWGRTSEDEDTIVWVIGEFNIPLKQLSNYNIHIHARTNLQTYDLRPNQTNRLERPPQCNRHPTPRPVPGPRESSAAVITPRHVHPTTLHHRNTNQKPRY